MERNSKQYNLKELFTSLVTEGLTDNNKDVIEAFLCGVLDTPQGKDIFNSSLFYNFILLLKSQPTTTFLLNHLIQEVELKSLRLTYLALAEETQIVCCQPPSNNSKQGMNQFNVSPVSEILDIAEGRKKPDDRRANR